MKCCPASRVVRGPELAAVSGNDGSAHCQPQAHPLSLRREEWRKYTLHFFVRDAAPLVGHRYTYRSGAGQPGGYEESAIDRLELSHRIATINKKVEKHLLELYVV